MLLGTAQGTFLIFALLGKKGTNRMGHGNLAILLYAITSYFLYALLENFDGFHFFKSILKINSIAIGALIGPSFFLFVKSYLVPGKRNWKLSVWHFLPYFLLLFVLATMELVYGKITAVAAIGSPTFVYLIEGIKTVHIITYMALTASLLFHLPKAGNILFQGNSMSVVRWLGFLLVLFMLTVLGSLLFFIWAKFFSTDIIDGEPIYVVALLVLVVYSIAYMAIRFPLSVSKEEEVLVFKRSPKYRTSPLRESDMLRILDLAKKEMETNKPYLNESLTIESLAEKLQIPVHHLSQSINQLHKRSFNDFVNGYRVEEFKARISNGMHDHKTILGIALESGFASKSSFNRIFKSLTQMTPNAYKKMKR